MAISIERATAAQLPVHTQGGKAQSAPNLTGPTKSKSKVLKTWEATVTVCFDMPGQQYECMCALAQIMNR